MPYSPAGIAATGQQRVHASVGSVGNGIAVVSEVDPGGAGTVSFTSGHPFILIRPNDIAVKWVLEAKCADGAIIELTPNSARLHIVELKSKLDTQAWEKVKLQFSGMMLRVMALCGVLGIREFSSVVAYVAYKEEVITTFLASNPAALKLPLGGGRGNKLGVDWKFGNIDIQDYSNIKLINILRRADGNADYIIPA